MSKTQVINLGKTDDKWLKLMHYLQNALPGTYQLVFPDSDSAVKASRRLSEMVTRHPTWFPMVVCQRYSCVYVIKVPFAQKVIVKDTLDSIVDSY